MKPLVINTDTHNITYEHFTIMQSYDYEIEVNIYENGEPVNLSSCSCTVNFTKPNGNVVFIRNNITLVDNKVKFKLDNITTNKFGEAQLQVVLNYPNGNVFGSWVIRTIIRKGAVDDNAVNDPGIASAIQELIKTMADANEVLKTVDLTGYMKKTDIINNLTSTSTNVALAAAQGKVLNDKFGNYATKEHTHSDYASSTHTHIAVDLPSASTTAKGLVQLNDSLTSNDDTMALTAKQGRELKNMIDSNSSVAIANKVGFVAHRGFHPRAPENTLKSISEAGKLGFVACELDPRLTSDNVFILMHDATVDRTTNGTGNVANMTLAQIKALNIDSGLIDTYETIKVPTLEEALQEIAYWNMGVNLDGGYTTWNEDRVKTIYNLLVKYNLDEISMVSTPLPESRPLFAQHAPNLAQLIVTTPALLDSVLTNYSYINKLIIGLRSNDATAEAIATCNAKNIPVFLFENYAVSHATMHLNKGVSYVETDNILPQGGLRK